MSKDDVDAVLNEATSELSDDLRDRGNIPITEDYYDRIVRSAAFEISNKLHGQLCTLSRAIQVIHGVRLYMEQHGYFTLVAVAYLWQGTMTRITDVVVAKWPPRHGLQRYYISLGAKLIPITYVFFSPQNSSRALKTDFHVAGTDLVGHSNYGIFLFMSCCHLPSD